MAGRIAELRAATPGELRRGRQPCRAPRPEHAVQLAHDGDPLAMVVFAGARVRWRCAALAGASRSHQGIGEGYAKALAQEGAAVAIAELSADQGQRVAKEIQAAGGKAIFVKTDVSSESSTRAMGETVRRELGGVDYLVNNAAIYHDMELHGLLTRAVRLLHEVHGRQHARVSARDARRV